MKKSVIALLVGLVAIVLIVAIVIAGKSDNKTNDTSNNNSSSANDTPAGHDNGNTGAENVPVEATEVNIKDGGYGPKVITVKKGTTVTWTNNGEVAHTVTVDEGEGPDSPLIDPGETYQYTFDTVGTFDYHCAPHPNMTGSVVVTE